MEAQLQILLLEDSANDAALIGHELRQGKLAFTLTRVDDRPSLLAALKAKPWDIILADYSLPQFRGVDVLECLKREDLDIPVILVTGCLSHQVATGFLREGIEDFVLKDQLSRLPVSIAKALERKRLEHRHRQDQKALELAHEKLRLFSSELQRAREKERKRISLEIHDELGNILSIWNLEVAALERLVADQAKPLLSNTKRLQSLVSEFESCVRRISTELRPRLLDELGLGPALLWYTRNFEKRHGIQCASAINVEHGCGEEVSIALFRITQEALTNVVRHAQATRVEVSLQETEANFMLEVKDNGRGITNEDVQNATSFGIYGIRERAELLGGNAEVQRLPRRGTSVRVAVPKSQN